MALVMARTLNLDHHICITSANTVAKIAAPLIKTFNIKHFRYLKLFNDGSRVLLSNYSDCTRFMYEEGRYKTMWFDGGRPECLTEGYHIWDVLRALDPHQENDPLQNEISLLLDLNCGITFVQQGLGFYEIYTFDTNSPAIYHVDKKLLFHFTRYFKSEAANLIKSAEEDKIYGPIKAPLCSPINHQTDQQISAYLNKTPINRFYLSGKYSHIYLTPKEIKCILWAIQGKTAEEIAMIEKNSFRTVEMHLTNVRKKLNCYKQTQLIRIILEAGVLQAFE